MLSSTLILIITFILVLVSQSSNMRDGFRVSLIFLLLFIGFVQYVLALIMPDYIKDNWVLITMLILFALSIISLVIGKITSKHHNQLN